jgi:glycerol-1-phosphate dehydrogenase [NAD(P)+]
MRIESQKFNGMCECGENHKMTTRAAIIESHASANVRDYLREFGFEGSFAAIYDENTYQAKALNHPDASLEIVLPPENLHANERATDFVLSKLKGHTVRYLVAVGSGTIHDTTRYCAHKLGIPFVSMPTAASVDGFCSTVSAMTWRGCKKTMPGVAPDLVIADTSVIKEAPLRLNLSGIGDILGKYSALADWQIASAVTGEHFCSRIHELTMKAVQTVYECCDQVVSREEGACAQLIYALLLSGLAMQMMGNSRPASGAEHHISHTIEMEPPAIGVHSDGLHGEKVGVGEIMISQWYHKLVSIHDIENHVQEYRFWTEEELREFWGDSLYEGIAAENDSDAMAGVSPEDLIHAWPEIRKIVNSIPTPEDLEKLYTRLGMKKTLEDLQVPEDKADQILYFSPSVRKRTTFNRISRMIKL